MVSRKPPNPLQVHWMTEYTHTLHSRDLATVRVLVLRGNKHRACSPASCRKAHIERNFCRSARSRYTGQHLSSTHLIPQPLIPTGQNNCRSYRSSKATSDLWDVRASPASPRVQTTQTLWAREEKETIKTSIRELLGGKHAWFNTALKEKSCGETLFEERKGGKKK